MNQFDCFTAQSPGTGWLRSFGFAKAPGIELNVAVSSTSSNRRRVVLAAVTPLASILGSGLLIIVPVLERTLGSWSVFGAIGVCAVAWMIGTVIRHNVRIVEPLEDEGSLDGTTVRLGEIADLVIVVAYVISVALYLRIMAQYVVGLVDSGGSGLAERIIACTAVAAITVLGALRGFNGLDRLDRVSLAAVLVLTTVLGAVLVIHDGIAATRGDLRLPPSSTLGPTDALLVLGGIVITVQGFETVRYLRDEYDAETRVRASRLAQLVAAGLYISFVAIATPAMGLGTSDGPDNTLLDITARVAPWLAIPLVASAVLSQLSAAIADTVAADGNLHGLSSWFHGPRPFLISGAAAIALAATMPILTIVAVASRAFAAYYAFQAVIALRTSSRLSSKVSFGLLALLMVAITLLARPAG